MTATITTARPRLDDENPWPGLESFREAEGAYFFGRETEAVALSEHVLDAPVTVLYGRSGLGKTSLLRAGLFPRLREQHFLPVYMRFEVRSDATPLSWQLRQSVHEAIHSEVPGASLPAQESLWEYLHRRVIRLTSANGDRLTPVIVLDQFEELFTLGERAPSLVEAFRNDFGDLAENRIPAELSARIETDEGIAAQFDLRSRNYKLLISLREDFLAPLEEWRQLIPVLGQSRMRLLPLNSDDAFAAVHEPAKNLMTAALAKRVVDIVAGEIPQRDGESVTSNGHRGGLRATYLEPALLSLFCRELNEERKRRGQTRFEAQLVENAKTGILSNYYSSCVHDLPQVAKFIEDRLISETGFRNQFAREDAVPSILTDGELDQLIDSRLLRIVEYSGAQRIELTHDVLTGVVQEHRDQRRVSEEKQKLEAARQHAHTLMKRSRVLVALLAVTALVAVAAIGLGIAALHAKREATAAQQQADDRRSGELAERLTSEGNAILAGGQDGSTLSAMVKLLAAQHLSSTASLGGLLNALSDQSRVRAINSSRGISMGGDLSGDGRRVLHLDAGGTSVVDTQTWQQVGHVVDLPEWLRTGLSFNGRYFASYNVSSDKAIRVQDFDTGDYIGEPMSYDSAEGFVGNVAVNSDASRVAAVDSTDTVRLWDVESGQPIATLPFQPGEYVFTLAFSPEGGLLAAGGSGGSIRLWDATTGNELRDTEPASDERVEGDDDMLSIAFSPDGRAVGAGGRTVGLGPLSGGMPLRLWNTETGALIATPMIGDYGQIRSLAFSPGGRRIATGSDNRSVQLWDASTGQPVGEPLRFQSDVWQIAFNGDGSQIVVVSGGGVERVDADPGVGLPVETEGSKAAVLDRYEGFGVRESDDGAQIMYVQDSALHSLDAETGEEIKVVENELIAARTDLESSRHDHWLAVAGEDNIIRVIDTSNGRLVGKPMQAHTETVNDLEFSPNGELLASASDDSTVRLWNWRRGQQLGESLTTHEYGADAVTFSDGRYLFTRGSGTAWIWDLRSGHPTGKQLWTGTDSVVEMAVRKDGRTVATALDSGTILQWDVQSGEVDNATMTGHSDRPNAIAYSLDGRYLASAGQEGTDDTLRFWDTASGRQIGESLNTEPIGSASMISFSEDGRWLYIVAQGVSMAGEGPLAGRNAVWKIPAPPEWEHALCDKLAVNPNEEQWKEWVSDEIPFAELCPGKPQME